nr:ribonuclease H-like domain, reverse transcriptase, RNA-dependent DNA polymerase [Tanacetum cinerariifolium]
MVAILEKGEFNSDFHPMVDFIAASPLRYALTVKPTIFVSHIRQFRSTARIKTTDEGTHILATVDGIQRTVSESSLRPNLKLRDEDGIISIPDTELFENLTLMGYNISQNQKLTFQKGKFSHQWKYLIHTIMQCLSPKSTRFNEFSSNIATTLVCLATNRAYNFSKMIFDGMVKNINNKTSKFLMYPRIVPLFDTMLIQQGEGSGTPTEPHHTPSPESSALPTVADKPTSPVRDDSQREACPTDSGFIADQDRAIFAKSSTLPRDSAPRVTSPAAEEGSMQQTLNELTAFCTSLQRQHLELLAKFQAQEVAINRLKEKVKIIEDKEGVIGDKSRDDAPIKGRSPNEGEAPAERISNDSEEIARVLTSTDAATVLAGETNVPTGSGFIPTAGEAPAERIRNYSEEITRVLTSMDATNVLAGETNVPTSSGFIPTAGPPATIEEAERAKRQRIILEKEQVKKQKPSEEAPESKTPTEEVSEDKIKEMMQLV